MREIGGLVHYNQPALEATPYSDFVCFLVMVVHNLMGFLKTEFEDVG
jgi:hypothetical protein